MGRYITIKIILIKQFLKDWSLIAILWFPNLLWNYSSQDNIGLLQATFTWMKQNRDSRKRHTQNMVNWFITREKSSFSMNNVVNNWLSVWKRKTTLPCQSALDISDNVWGSLFRMWHSPTDHVCLCSWAGGRRQRTWLYSISSCILWWEKGIEQVNGR